MPSGLFEIPHTRIHTAVAAPIICKEVKPDGVRSGDNAAAVYQLLLGECIRRLRKIGPRSSSIDKVIGPFVHELCLDEGHRGSYPFTTGTNTRVIVPDRIHGVCD